MRAWGERELGLVHTSSYETYVDLHGRPVSWLVTACPPDSLKPESWWFPVVGRVPYLGFFDIQDAREERDSLAAKGFDVNVRPVPAYSTLGWFADPVFSTFVDWPAHLAVDTILHETTHATVWIPGSVALNESLANLVGEEGARRFLRERFGPDSAEARALDTSRAESKQFRAFMMELNSTLKSAYALDLPRIEKIALKAAILRRAKERFREIKTQFTNRYYREFDRLDWNNALVASMAVYDEKQGAWRRLFESKGGDLRGFLEAARALAKEKNPEAALGR
ncbi:MAG: aminopeptidase [Planctomycetes bacterium]|nr:aminopeptidase [Planctomycetota bacterium]